MQYLLAGAVLVQKALNNLAASWVPTQLMTLEGSEVTWL